MKTLMTVHAIRSVKISTLSPGTKLPKTFTMSSAVKVLNLMPSISASRSSADVGIPMPPKSVK